MPNSRIAGSGSYLHEKVLTNKDLEKTLDTSDEWIRERSGIARRHIAADDETTSDMALVAVNRALEAAGRTADDIDLIVVATTTPDKIFPSTACIIQRRLGIRNCPAMDVAAACAGFVYALDVADRFIRTGGASRALVIGAETYSRILNWEDRTTAVLFGDGAGCVVLEATEDEGVISTHVHSDGQFEDLLHVPKGISTGYKPEEAGGYIEMKGNAVFKRAVATLDSMARETLERTGLEASDIDWLVPHQANLRIIAAAAKKFALPMERVVVTVDEHANTSSASIPLALDTAVRDGRIKRGELLLFEAFGAGFTWGSALVRY